MHSDRVHAAGVEGGVQGGGDLRYSHKSTNKTKRRREKKKRGGLGVRLKKGKKAFSNLPPLPTPFFSGVG